VGLTIIGGGGTGRWCVVNFMNLPVVERFPIVEFT
jgi:hypothetical protein